MKYSSKCTQSTKRFSKSQGFVITGTSLSLRGWFCRFLSQVLALPYCFVTNPSGGVVTYKARGMRVFEKKMRGEYLVRALIALLPIASASWVLGEEPRSPFERASKPVVVEKPVTVAPSRLDKMEFTGLLGFGGEITISLYDTETKQSLWVPLDGSQDGISVSGFDEENGTISVSLQGITRTIAINENEIVALKRTEPVVTSNGSAPVVPNKPVRIKDDETLRKEEEARSFVSNLLANSMVQREEYRKAQAARTANAKGK